MTMNEHGCEYEWPNNNKSNKNNSISNNNNDNKTLTFLFRRDFWYEQR